MNYFYRENFPIYSNYIHVHSFLVHFLQGQRKLVYVYPLVSTMFMFLFLLLFLFLLDWCLQEPSICWAYTSGGTSIYTVQSDLIVGLCPYPTREERVWGHSADSSGLLSGEKFPSANHIVENTICGCNTGNPWLLQHNDTAVFGGVN